jgi:hypothetical protein
MTPEEALILILIGGMVCLAGLGYVFKFLYENGVMR